SRFADSVFRYDGRTGAPIDAYVPAGASGLDEPSGLLFDPAGRLFVSSNRTDSVLRIDGPDGGPGDADSYTLALDANQTLSLQVTAPAGTTVTATHSA